MLPLAFQQSVVSLFAGRGVFSSGLRRLCLEGFLRNFRATLRSIRGTSAACLLTLPICASAEVTYRVTFDDPEALLETWRAPIESNLLGAGALWSKRLLGETELWIEVQANPLIAELECRSFTWSYLNTLEGAIDVFETGASIHIRNGFPASSFHPDIIVEIHPDFARDELWFDPDPIARTESVDPLRVDAVSEFARGLGRALAFDGWMNGNDGTFPGTSRSVFDQLVVFDGNDFRFTGENAVAKYLAPVPLTFGDPFHVGNGPPRPGMDLLNDVMSGMPLTRGMRYNVSALDFAILQDARVPIVLPCPCDLNHDGLVDDADFLAFTDAYNVYDCADPAMAPGCPCDFNADASVDDSDYLIFFVSYEQLLCP